MRALDRTFAVRGRRFSIKAEDSNTPSDYLKYEALRNDVWDFPEDHLSGVRNMMCENVFHEGSSLFIAAYAADEDGRLEEDEAHLAGFSYGFVGLKDKKVGYASPANLWFYAQFTAVRPEFQGYGLGIRIKEFQRDVVLDVLGVSTVVCTYDPLTGANAYRNVHHFRMTVVEYRAAAYGEYGGRLNRADVPTDRFFMSWDLRIAPRQGNSIDRQAPPDPERSVVAVAERVVAGRSGPVGLEIAAGFHRERARDHAFVRIPRDFYLMLRETDVEDPSVRRIPVDWRRTTRDAFQTLFADGYAVVDFLSVRGEKPSNFYVLKKAAG
jgi:predicted GNAT superfamily acetyltransferase